MNARVLLVDDHEINLATLEAILEPEGYELRSVRRGEEVPDSVREFAPDLVLLDVMMPGMDGYAVCRAIRADARIAAVPVVMVTALNDRDSRLAGIEAGADDFISKPVYAEELRARVRTITRLNRYRVIADQRARLERLLELAPSAIMVARADGEVVSANRRAEEFFACFGGGPLSGRQLGEGLPSRDAWRLLDLVAAVARADGGSEALGVKDLRLRGPSSERVLDVSARRLEERPEPLALLSFHDVTAEVRARENAESINRRLDTMVRERTRRLEEANQVLASYSVFVAHDLRSPLSAVKGYVTLLLGEVWPLPREVRECLRQTELAIKMIDEMVTDTLTLAGARDQAEAGARRVRPRQVLERLCARLVGLKPPPRPQIVIHDLPEVAGSALLVERIFFNLLTNALKYSAARPAPCIEIGSVDTADGPAIYVRDNGVGFPESEAAALFTKFTRLSTAEGHDGLGIGLSLVARLVHAHHGRIWAESRPGEGATFYVFLPAPDPVASPLAAA